MWLEQITEYSFLVILGFKEDKAKHWKILVAERGKTILSISPMEIISFPLESLNAISTKCSLSIPFPLEKSIERGSLDSNGSVMFKFEIIFSQLN